jgi:hypothetical protein
VRGDGPVDGTRRARGDVDHQALNGVVQRGGSRRSGLVSAALSSGSLHIDHPAQRQVIRKPPYSARPMPVHHVLERLRQ